MMNITSTPTKFENNSWTYSFRFEWSGSEGENIRIEIDTYHGQQRISTWADTSFFYDENTNTHNYGLTVTGLPPYYRMTLRVKTTVTYEREFFVENHPNHPMDSYIKDIRCPVHTQYARYKNAYYMYEVNSCVANTLCAGMDTVHRKLYGKPSRPSVGYLYGSVEKDKDDAFGMLFESALSYLLTKGVATASMISGDANQENYTHNHFKQKRTIPDSSMVNMLVEGGVQMHNRTSVSINVAETEKYSMLSDYQKQNITDNIINMMNATMRNDKFVMLCLGICSEFDNASNGDGVCPRLMKNTNYRMGHSCLVVGWKKIGSEYYWILQNSWGSNKGDNGLIYMPFSWFWTSVSGGDAGLWYGYICTYRQNGEMLLKPVSPPILNTSEEKEGRGDFGRLYLKYPTVGSTIGDEHVMYYIKYIDESGASKESMSYGWGDGGYAKDYITTRKYGETFRVSVRYETDHGVLSASSSENLATTLPKEPSVTLNKTTTNSITLNVNVSEGKWTDVAVHMYENSVYIRTIIVPKGVTTCTFADLKSQTKYAFNAETRYLIRGTTLISYNKSNQIEATTAIGIQKFYWTTKILQNISIAYNNGSDNRVNVYPITATEWNTYIDTLKKCRELKGVSTSRPLTTAARGVKLTPLINQAIDALNDMLPTGKITNISSTTKLTSTIFISLQDKLNGVIDGIIQ